MNHLPAIALALAGASAALAQQQGFVGISDYQEILFQRNGSKARGVRVNKTTSGTSAKFKIVHCRSVAGTPFGMEVGALYDYRGTFRPTNWSDYSISESLVGQEWTFSWQGDDLAVTLWSETPDIAYYYTEPDIEYLDDSDFTYVAVNLGPAVVFGEPVSSAEWFGEIYTSVKVRPKSPKIRARRVNIVVQGPVPESSFTGLSGALRDRRRQVRRHPSL